MFIIKKKNVEISFIIRCINFIFRFSNLDGNMQAILTNWAAFHQTVKGVTLFYSSGDLECYVSTSTRRWSVSSSVTLEELKW